MSGKGDIWMKFWHYLTLILLVLISEPACAYLDPGTGSMLLQVILGGVAAVGVALKLFWHKIRIAVGLGRRSGTEEENA
jgi:hypothetical protein